MKDWGKARISLLATVFGATVLVLGKLILSPNVSDRLQFSSFTFPAAVPLPQWQLSAIAPLNNQTISTSQFQNGMQYKYIQNGLSLDIGMRYLVNTDGEVKKYLKDYTFMDSNIELSPVVRQQKEIGFYKLFSYQGKAYLSSCINPRGNSTVTDEQFRRNRNIYDLRSPHIFLWLLGQANFRDNRCLWANLSIPLNNDSPEKAYQILEKAWFPWYQWWSLRFPQE